MPDNEPGSAQGQAPSTPQPQAGAESPPQAGGAQMGQAPSATGETGTGNESAKLREELEEARREAAKLRAESKRRADADKAAEDAKLSEAERIQRELAELKAKNQELEQRDRENAFQRSAISVATKLGFRNPDMAARLIDRTQVDWTDAGQPRNLERLLGEILRSDPYLGRSTPDFGGGNRGGTPQGTDMNAFIRRAAGRQP